MNLLSIGAAYGVVVAVFQWGWGGRIIGIDKTGPIAPFIPMMMFAILFGLSMDYEVFLLSRIREEYDRTGDNAAAVGRRPGRDGAGDHRGRAIMVCVFASFMLGDDAARQAVRPRPGRRDLHRRHAWCAWCWCPRRWSCSATANWWLPRRLDRIVPDMRFRDHAAAAEPERAPASVA